MDFCFLTKEPIVTENFLNRLKQHPSSGALHLFVGTVRNENNGKNVRHIFYECYEPMARKEFQNIMKETREKWPVHLIGIAHRLGKVNVGETSLMVSVSSSHRQEGGTALQYIVEQIKKKVPIWKQEFYENGDVAWL